MKLCTALQLQRLRGFPPSTGTTMTERYWLIKGEADSRIEKGVDVKFGIDDLQRVGTSSWEGVRNYEARNIMRDKMRAGDIVRDISFL